MHAKPDSALGRLPGYKTKSHRDANSLVLQLAQSASDDGVGSCATYSPGTQVLTGVHVALFTSELKVPAEYKPRNHRITVSCEKLGLSHTYNTHATRSKVLQIPASQRLQPRSDVSVGAADT